MPYFSYIAFTHAGERKRGAVAAPDEVAALEMLSRKGLTPTDLRSGMTASEPWWRREVRLTHTLVADEKALLEMFAALSILIEAKVPLTRALQFVETQVRKPKLSAAVVSLREELENGRSLAQALQSQEEVFPPRIIALLTLGEVSDALAETMTRITEILRTEAEMKAEARSALFYPVILLMMSCLVLTLLVFYLVPTLVPVFQSAGAAPPPVLIAMDSVRRGIVIAGWPALLGLGLLVFTLFALRRAIGFAVGGFMARAPVIGPFLAKRESLIFCQNLTLMLGAGMSALDGLKSAEAAMQHVPWRREVQSVRADVEAGVSLSVAIEHATFLDPMAKSLIRAGDETDKLIDMLAAASKALQSDTHTTLKRALSLMTPVITLLIGGLVGVLILSTITAILDLNDIVF